MERIDARHVKLTDEEFKLHDKFDELLDEGLSLETAAVRLLAAEPSLSRDLLLYLVYG